MSIKVIIFYIALLSLSITTAQKRYIIGGPDTIESLCNVSNSELDSQLKNIVDHIIKKGDTDSEKAQAIFNWIGTHIGYDNELRFDKSLQKETYTSESKILKRVLKQRKALCGGYAFLFSKLCETVGITTQVIHGYTKMPGLKRKHNKVHHTWNAVKLNGQWQLLDITWAKSHSVNGTPNTEWYGVKPKTFIKSHLPKDPKWTLLGYSFTLQEFDLAL